MQILTVKVIITMQGLDTVESLSVEVRGSKVSKSSTLEYKSCQNISSTVSCDQKQGFSVAFLLKYFYYCSCDQQQGFSVTFLLKYFQYCSFDQKQGFFVTFLLNYFQYCSFDQKQGFSVTFLLKYFQYCSFDQKQGLLSLSC